MALVNHNITLEYAPNTLQFTLLDDAGAPQDFDGDVHLSIERMDDSTKVYNSANFTPVGNVVTMTVSPTENISKTGDSLFEYDHPVYEHIYCLRSSTTVYMSGKANMVRAAGV